MLPTSPDRPRAKTKPWLVSATFSVLFLAAGCSETADLSSLDLYRGSGGTAGGTAASGGRSGANDTPPNASATATAAPTAGGDGVQCKMWDRDTYSCVTCVDASGKTVREECFPKPSAGKCQETKDEKGNVCIICWDDSGKEIKRDCRPTTGTGNGANCGGPVMSPPADPGMCKSFEDNGAKCTVCVDANGKEVSRACAGPGMQPNQDPGPVTCTETSYPDGTRCTVCTDAKGNVIKKGCWSPAPMPGTPSMITCKDYEQNGAKCTVCTDEKGTVVKQGCSTPPSPPTTMPPGMPTPPPPATMPAIDCRTFKDATSVCIVCTDEKGRVVKQECHPTR